MNFTFETQGTNTLLVYEVKPEDALDNMSLGMLTNNKINGLATTLFMQMNMTKYIKYNVSAKISVKQFFAGPVNKKRLIGVFSGIVDAMLSAEEYMIDTNSILLDLEHIYADVSTCETVLICLPVVDLEMKSTDLGMFFKNLVFSTQFDQTENCDYVAKIINYLNSSPVFSLTDFKAVLETIKKGEETVKPQSEVKMTAKPQPTVQQPVIPQQAIQQPVIPQTTQPQAVIKQPIKQQTINQPKVQPSLEKPKQEPEKKQGFAIPGKKAESVEAVKEETKTEEKEMSMFYLLQHYSKKNAAIYKAQQNAKKEAKKAKGKNVEKEEPKIDYTVPGAPVEKPVSDYGFAVPGQATPAIVPEQPKQESVSMYTESPVIHQAEQTVVAPVAMTQSATLPQGRSMNFGETVVLNTARAGETTVLNKAVVEVQASPHLIRNKNNEKIILNKPVFRIGKEKSYVDYFISDNTAISRSHANIITRENEYFIMDTNSTNHTYVDGIMIPSNSEVSLTHGARVRLANEEFVFFVR